jgi:hypothetical protein
MPNRSTDALFQLVKSLEKSEKRNFKLYVKRNSSSEDLKIVKLFDALDKLDAYDEEQLLKKNKSIRKATAFQHEGAFVQTNTFKPSAH